MTAKTNDRGRDDRKRDSRDRRGLSLDARGRHLDTRVEDARVEDARGRPSGQWVRRWPDLPVQWEQVFDEAERLSVLVGRILQEASRLGPAQYQVLAQLDRHGPMTLTQLSRALGCTRGNITGVTDRLLGQGLIKREPNPGDARSSLISLTPAGADRLAVARGALQSLAASTGTNGLARLVPRQYVVLAANRRPGAGRREFIRLDAKGRAQDIAGDRQPGRQHQPGRPEQPGSQHQPGSDEQPLRPKPSGSDQQPSSQR